MGLALASNISSSPALRNVENQVGPGTTVTTADLRRRNVAPHAVHRRSCHCPRPYTMHRDRPRAQIIRCTHGYLNRPSGPNMTVFCGTDRGE
jgi:hypothetical protein